jgi:FkbM family methyltransferase
MQSSTFNADLAWRFVAGGDDNLTSVNYLAGDSNLRALHISIRKNLGMIVINTMVDGVWGDEDVLRDSTLASRPELTLDVSCRSDGYVVFFPEIDNYMFRKHVVAPETVNGLELVGPVKVVKTVDAEPNREVAGRAPKRDEENENPVLAMHLLLHVRAFGQDMDLLSPPLDGSGAPALMRLKKIYEPYLTSRPIDSEGVFIDIGAGFGTFAIPLAKALPRARFYCFEPAGQYFDLLQQNIRTHGLSNVAAFKVAVIGDVGEPGDEGPALDADNLDVSRLCSPVDFWASSEFDSFLRRYPAQESPLEGAPPAEIKTFPAIQASALKGLKPHLVKISAPGWEAEILEALRGGPAHIVGEVHRAIPSKSLFGAGAKDFFVKLAGSNYGLRRDGAFATPWKPGLDVVVPTYNARKYIVECVESIVARSDGEIRALVVDDGSSDGCGEMVAQHFTGDERIVVLRKANGGCASARNYGRRFSRSEHIAFVDADDRVDPDFFPKLLETARYTGAEIVQAGFCFLDETSNGLELRACYEEGQFADWSRDSLGDLSLFHVRSEDLIEGQPTIWRRVYRRDFLDNKNVYFPEHIRAFDDLYFHSLTLYYAGTVPMIDGPKYHYRQHPAQDIKQGDERHFYELEMYRLMIKRALEEGWNDFRPIAASLVKTINWSLGSLREDLVGPFLRGAVDLWVIVEQSLGTSPFDEFGHYVIAHPDFRHHLEVQRRRVAGFHISYSWAYLDNVLFHPSTIMAIQRQRYRI